MAFDDGSNLPNHHQWSPAKRVKRLCSSVAVASEKPWYRHSRKSPRTGDRSLLDVSLGCYPLRVSQPLAKTIGVWLSMGLINSAQTVIHLSLNQSLIQTFVSSGNDFRLDRRQPQKPAIPAPESSRPTLPGSGTGNTSCEVHSPGTT